MRNIDQTNPALLHRMGGDYASAKIPTMKKTISNSLIRNLQKHTGHRTETLVLICSYSVISTGSKLQKLFCNARHIDNSMSIPPTERANGRIRRLGQMHIVENCNETVPVQKPPRLTVLAES